MMNSDSLLAHDVVSNASSDNVEFGVYEELKPGLDRHSTADSLDSTHSYTSVTQIMESPVHNRKRSFSANDRVAVSLLRNVTKSPSTAELQSRAHTHGDCYCEQSPLNSPLNSPVAIHNTLRNITNNDNVADYNNHSKSMHMIRPTTDSNISNWRSVDQIHADDSIVEARLSDSNTGAEYFYKNRLLSPGEQFPKVLVKSDFTSTSSPCDDSMDSFMHSKPRSQTSSTLFSTPGTMRQNRFHGLCGNNCDKNDGTLSPERPSTISTKMNSLVIDSVKKVEPATKRSRRSDEVPNVGSLPPRSSGGSNSGSATSANKQTPVLGPCVGTPVPPIGRSSSCSSFTKAYGRSGGSNKATASSIAALEGTPITTTTNTTPNPNKRFASPTRPMKPATFLRRFNSINGLNCKTIEDVESRKQQVALISTEKCAKLVENIKKTGIRMAAIDFDQTFIKCNTRSKWAGTAETLSLHVRPAIRDFALQCLKSGLCVAIVTFSAQRDIIEKLMRLIIPEQYWPLIVVEASCERFRSLISQKEKQMIKFLQQRTRLPPKAFAENHLGKMAHIWAAMQRYSKRLCNIGALLPTNPCHCLLIDDCPTNINICKRYTAVKAFQILSGRPNALFDDMMACFVKEERLANESHGSRRLQRFNATSRSATFSSPATFSSATTYASNRMLPKRSPAHTRSTTLSSGTTTSATDQRNSTPKPM